MLNINFVFVEEEAEASAESFDLSALPLFLYVRFVEIFRWWNIALDFLSFWQWKQFEYVSCSFLSIFTIKSRILFLLKEWEKLDWEFNNSQNRVSRCSLSFKCDTSLRQMLFSQKKKWNRFFFFVFSHFTFSFFQSLKSRENSNKNLYFISLQVRSGCNSI